MGIVKYLATQSGELKRQLIDHEYSGIKAVHQVISIGNMNLIHILVTDYNADLNSTVG